MGKQRIRVDERAVDGSRSVCRNARGSYLVWNVSGNCLNPDISGGWRMQIPTCVQPLIRTDEGCWYLPA